MGAGSLRRASGCRTSTPTLHPRRGMATRSEPSRCEAPDGAVHRTARAALDLPFLRRVLPRKFSVPMSTERLDDDQHLHNTLAGVAMALPC
jgi:hypothetical protein